jgi:uncharacterized protein with ParB-like and HNH nuclease domain
MPKSLQEQLDSNRRNVSFDSYDITVRQVYDMILKNMIDIAPEYQRHFKWDEKRQSQLIESLFLGIPVPSLFMATNKDSTWEVIDGLQRLTTLINFIGTFEETKSIIPKFQELRLQELDKLDTFNNLTYRELPTPIQIMFQTRSLRITVLNDRSDFKVRYDLFERLNTGGIILHAQEIRNCIFLGPFNDFLKDCVRNADFQNVIKMTKNAERNRSLEELVLRFFAYYEDTDKFDHSVNEFLNDYMAKKSKNLSNKPELLDIFSQTFKYINQNAPNGIVRSNRKNVTPIVLFEAVAVGIAKAIKGKNKLLNKKLTAMLDDRELKETTTGATNSRSMLSARLKRVRELLFK